MASRLDDVIKIHLLENAALIGLILIGMILLITLRFDSKGLIQGARD